MKFNRHIIFGRLRYNTYCNDPCYYINPEGARLIKLFGWHPETNPWIDDNIEFLLSNHLIRCCSMPTTEYQIDQLNYEFLYGSILG